MKKDEKKRQGNCEHPRCKTIVDEGGYCYGCRKFVCEKHATNLSAMGFGHPASAHWSIEDAEA